jgi:hypothetical protein
MKLIKCLDSFLIGFYLAFVLTLMFLGYFVVNKFVSKDMLTKDSFYMDGQVYEVKRR